MNRNKLKHYAPQARRDFIAAVTARAAYYGLTTNKIEPITEQGDVALIGGKPFPRSAVGQTQTPRRARSTARASSRSWRQWPTPGLIGSSLSATWSCTATWTTATGCSVIPRQNPRQKLSSTPSMLIYPDWTPRRSLNSSSMGIKRPNSTACCSLPSATPCIVPCRFCLTRIDDETELLLPDNLLHSDSLIRKLVNAIDEEEWQEVEIIGWLYQFYISEKKDAGHR